MPSLLLQACHAVGVEREAAGDEAEETLALFLHALLSLLHEVAALLRRGHRHADQAQPYIALLLHFYSKTSVEDVPAASGDLLRELWSGNAENAISRFKVLAALRSGPHLVRAVLAWLGLDDTRPMLLCRVFDVGCSSCDGEVAGWSSQS